MTDVVGPLGVRTIGAPAAGPAASAQTSSASSGARSVRLQYLRALAAAAVLLYHCSVYLEPLRGSDAFKHIFPGIWGAYGVAVFFALSGYLMSDLLRRDDPGTFLVSRIARIYPPMLLVVALTMAVFVLIGQPRGVNIWALALVPSGPRPYFLGVEWTLLYELTYYVALTVLTFMGLARFAPAVMLVWLVALLAAFVLGPGQAQPGTPTLSEFPLTVFNLPFVLGFLTGEMHRRGMLPRFLLLPALATLAPTLLWNLPDSLDQLICGLSAGLLIASAVRPPDVAARGPLGRFGVRLGDASYMLYLCHVPVITALSIILPGATPPALMWTIWLLASLAAALLLGPVDIGLHRRLKQVIAAAPRGRLTIVALGFIALFLALAVQGEFQMRAKAAADAQAERILAGPSSAAGPGVRMAIDEIGVMPTGDRVVRGYGVDVEKPFLVSHVALRQAGRTLVLQRLTRMRAATADALARPDLRKLRFGFSVALPGDLDCSAGMIEPFLLLEDGRSLPIPQGELARLCP